MRLARKNEATNPVYCDYLLWGLIAVELLMSFSFLGYFHIEPISITFAYIPVLAAGFLLGPKGSVIVGFVFGMASMWKASAFYVGAGDAVFSPVMSGYPVESILLSVGTRTLFGLIVGLMYRSAKNSRHAVFWTVVVTTLGRSIHTGLVYSCMEIFFPETGFTAADTVKDIMRWDYIPFLIIANAIILFCYFFRKSRYMTNLLYRLRMADKIRAIVPRNRKFLALTLVFVLAASTSVVTYFSDRIFTVLEEYGLELVENAAYDIVHLQIQFLFGMIALDMIGMIIIGIYQKNLNYLYYEAKTDGLTGLPCRELFFQTCEELLKNPFDAHPTKSLSFFILDIDDFKQINDVQGHPAGDGVLQEVAGYMTDVFKRKGVLGRLGGDEFVALLSKPMTKEEIESLLNKLKENINSIRVGEKNITCSIGVIPVEEGLTIDELYRNADRLLYEAKKKGKNQFVFGYRFGGQDADE